MGLYYSSSDEILILLSRESRQQQIVIVALSYLALADLERPPPSPVRIKYVWNLSHPCVFMSLLAGKLQIGAYIMSAIQGHAGSDCRYRTVHCSASSRTESPASTSTHYISYRRVLDKPSAGILSVHLPKDPEGTLESPIPEPVLAP